MEISIFRTVRRKCPWYCTVKLEEEEKDHVMERIEKEGTQALNMTCEAVGNEIIRMCLSVMADYMRKKGGGT